MYITTHIRLANICYKYYKREYNVNLDKKSFLYGSIEPDLHKRSKKIKHIYSVSVYKIKEYIEELKNEDLTLEEKSFLLGKISHYTADCFCKYHLEEYYGHSMIKHFVYEFLLDLKLNYILLFKRKIIRDILINIGCKDEKYIDVLNANREEYLNLKENSINDLCYTVKTMCALIVCGSENDICKKNARETK